MSCVLYVVCCELYVVSCVLYVVSCMLCVVSCKNQPQKHKYKLSDVDGKVVSSACWRQHWIVNMPFITN